MRSPTWRAVLDLVARGKMKISNHAFEELAADGILATDVVEGVRDAKVIEDYPDYPKGPCVLVLQRDSGGEPVHVVWGIPRGSSTPAVVVTVYRPDSRWWKPDFKRRMP